MPFVRSEEDDIIQSNYLKNKLPSIDKLIKGIESDILALSLGRDLLRAVDKKNGDE